MLLCTYRSLIRSKLDYGSIAYDSAKPHVLTLLNSIHNAALRIASGGFRTTPVQSLYTLTAEPSLSFRRNLLFLQYSLRIAAHVNHPVHNVLFTRRCQIIFEQNPSRYPPAYSRLSLLLKELNYSIAPLLSMHLCSV